MNLYKWLRRNYKSVDEKARKKITREEQFIRLSKNRFRYNKKLRYIETPGYGDRLYLQTRCPYKKDIGVNIASCFCQSCEYNFGWNKKKRFVKCNYKNKEEVNG